MITDVTGIVLTPGNGGRDCLGNGLHFDENGNHIECCCDECDYLICCAIMKNYDNCPECTSLHCPHSTANKKR